MLSKSEQNAVFAPIHSKFDGVSNRLFGIFLSKSRTFQIITSVFLNNNILK